MLIKLHTHPRTNKQLNCIRNSPPPLLHTRLGPRCHSFYLRHRDCLLILHSTFHYGMGGQFASHVRISNRVGPSSTFAFLASFLLSSTVLWQGVDALM